MIVHPKVGMHTAPAGGYGVPDIYIETLDANGIPTFMKGGDATSGVYYVQQKLQEQIAKHGKIITPHTAVYRTTLNDGINYSVLPDIAAQQVWDYHFPKIPKELDLSLVWIEMVNEPRYTLGWGTDPHPPEWEDLFTGWGDYVGWVCYYLGQLALSNGVKLCSPAFSSGNPDEGVWEQPGFVSYLQLCEQYPNSLGVAVHEYSLHETSIWSRKDGSNIVACSEVESDYRLIGRFLDLIKACDKLGIQKPNIFITEWGWTLWTIPPTQEAIDQIVDCGKFYAQYPQVKGMGLWYLGAGWQGIHEKVYTLIDPNSSPIPLLDATLSTEYIVDDPQTRTNFLVNGSFEEGGYHPGGDQDIIVPSNYDLWYTDQTGTYKTNQALGENNKVRDLSNGRTFVRVGETLENPHDPNSWSAFQKVGTRITQRTQNAGVNSIPNPVLDGSHGFSCEKKNVTFYFGLCQQISHPHQGVYKVNLKIFPWLVKGYTPTGDPIWGDDPQKRDGLIQIKVAGVPITDSQEVPGWHPLIPGDWNDIVYEYNGDGIQLVEIDFMCPFPLPENILYMDAWSIEENNMSSCNCPAIVDTKTVSLWIPQYYDLTVAELNTVIDWARNGFPLGNGEKTGGGHMLCPSHVDALRIHTQGLPGSILGIAYPSRIGTGVTIEWLEQNCPCALDNRTVIFLGEGNFQFSNMPI